MRIGRVEIRWIRALPWRESPISGRDLTGAFAVPSDEPWWLAVHQIIDQAEEETIRGARMRTQITNACIAAVGAGEGVDLVRTKLHDARAIALKSKDQFESGAYV
jgi:hypothetical protein